MTTPENDPGAGSPDLGDPAPEEPGTPGPTDVPPIFEGEEQDPTPGG